MLSSEVLHMLLPRVAKGAKEEVHFLEVPRNLGCSTPDNINW
jgi:hypothetical protein